jgi:hypothetical protein
MNFEDFLDESVINSNTEIQTFQSKIEARDIIAQTRGLMPGRYITQASAGEEDNSPVNHDTFGQNRGEQVNSKMVLKNNAIELIYVEKDEDKNTFITIVNKQKFTIRMISIDYKGTQLLKRFIQ